MKFTQDELNRQQTKLSITKAKDLPNGQFEAVLSTDDLDRHGERVSIKGLNIPANQTIKMYYNHETNGANLPIGKWNKVWKNVKGQLMGLGQIDLEDDFALKVYKKVQNGFIDSISIGFYPLEFDGDSSTWTKSTLVEASVVAEPANVNAVITSKKLGFTDAEFEKAVRVKLRQLEPDTAEPPEELNPPLEEIEPIPDEPASDEDGADDTEIKSIIEDLKSRIGAVEETLTASTEKPTIKTLIKLRVAAKQVDKAAETLNKTIKVKLKET